MAQGILSAAFCMCISSKECVTPYWHYKLLETLNMTGAGMAGRGDGSRCIELVLPRWLAL